MPEPVPELNAEARSGPTGLSHGATPRSIVVVPSDAATDALSVLERVIVNGAIVRAAVAFVTSEGVHALREIVDRRTGVSLEIVARAADITMPGALEALADELHATVSIVIGKHASAFHPKLWLVEHDGELVVLSGSGNLTSTGLRGNDEQFELYTVDAASDEAAAQTERFDALTAHALPFDRVRGTAIWREWLDVIRKQAAARRDLHRYAKALSGRDPQPDRAPDKAALLDDLQELYQRTREARLPRRDGVAYVPTRFGQAIGRARDGRGDPVRIVTSICRHRSRGFDVLLDSQRYDLTVEALVLDASKSYHDLFGPATRELCAERLRAFDDVDDSESIPAGSAARVFFESEDLSQTQLVPLIIDAALEIDGRATRDELVAAAIRVGVFTEDELAVPSHRERENERGWNAVEGRLQYAVWAARDQGALLIGASDGRQTVTEAGIARRGERTGYEVIDRRRGLSATT